MHLFSASDLDEAKFLHVGVLRLSCKGLDVVTGRIQYEAPALGLRALKEPAARIRGCFTPSINPKAFIALDKVCLEPPESVAFQDSSQLHRFLQPSLQVASLGLCIQQAMKASTSLDMPPQGLQA